jgi:hypothetical protein
MANTGEVIPLSEALLYQFEQAKYCLNKLNMEKTNPYCHKLDDGERNAYIESFLLNARNIADMFRGYRSSKSITYKDFLSKTGQKEFEESIDMGRLKKISETISSNASHLAKNGVKQGWRNNETYSCLLECHNLLIELIQAHPKP